MNTRRLLIYLGLNALVSAAVTLTVLWLWDRAHPAPPRASAPLPPTQVVIAPTTGSSTSAEIPPASPSSPTPTVYVVATGDTLGSIAEHFDVSVEDLMAANKLTDPDVLSVGQTLVIPVGGLAALATTAAALPTNAPEPPRPTATHDPNAPLPQLSIREVKSAGVLGDETLVIVNEGGRVDLAGWTLRDESGHLYTFPALTLFEGGAVQVHTAAGEDTVTDLYWGQPEAVWTSGKTALLSDPSGNLHARFTIP